MMVVQRLLARQVARHAVHFQLRQPRDQGRADARRRRRLDHGVRQPRLCDADLARSRPAAIAQHDGDRRRARRCRARTSRSRPACSTSRRWRTTRAFQVAVRTLGRLADPERVRQYRRQADADRDRAAARMSRASNSPRRITPRTPTSTAIRRWRSRSSSARARTRCRPARPSSRTMARACRSAFPTGCKHGIVYNPTQFIQESVDAVVETILEAVILVVLVVVLFLQTWRAAIIPDRWRSRSR